jgi:hypothetical protein
MKSSSLALIHNAAGAALQNPPQNRKVIRQVAGFDVEDEVPYAPQDVVQTFSQDAEALRASLSAAGITPLAVLPLVWWKQIVAKSKLLDFAPASNGTVAVRVTDHVTEIKNGWTPYFAFVGFSFALTLVAGAILLAADSSFNWSLSNFGIITLSLLWSMSLSSFLYWRKRARAEIVAGFYTAMRGGNNKLLFSILDTAGNSYQTRNVGVTLPLPPANVVDILLKAERAQVKMRVAAVPEAVTLAQSPRQLIANGLRSEWEADALARREARARAWREFVNDPIIYVVHGSAVAVIAQFGNFPIEQRIVDEVVKGGLRGA